MSEGPINQNHMIETTDCLEAVGVFRGWKNFFFLMVLLSLLVTQISFWLVDVKYVELPAAPSETATAETPTSGLLPTDPNAPAEAEPAGGKFGLDFLKKLNYSHLARTIDLVDGVLVVTAALYCMAMFFSLMVSLIGRLGGINHISRAFFLSLIMLVLILPWQKLIESSVVGAVYMSEDLITWSAYKTQSILTTILYYMRFAGYWAVVMLLLIMSQTRSARWTKAILRRLEII